MWLYDNGHPIRVSVRSIQLWNRCLNLYIMVGNDVDREASIIGQDDQYHMVLFLLAWSDARLDKITVFLANPEIDTVNSCPAVSRQMAKLGFTKKVESTEAKQASLPINFLKRELFWKEPLSFDVDG